MNSHQRRKLRRRDERLHGRRAVEPPPYPPEVEAFRQELMRECEPALLWGYGKRADLGVEG